MVKQQSSSPGIKKKNHYSNLAVNELNTRNKRMSVMVGNSINFGEKKSPSGDGASKGLHLGFMQSTSPNKVQLNVDAVDEILDEEDDSSMSESDEKSCRE